MNDIDILSTRVDSFTHQGELTALGRSVVTLSDRDLQRLVREDRYGDIDLKLVSFLLDFAMKRMPPLLSVLLKNRGETGNRHEVAAMILKKGGKRFEKEVHAFFRSVKDSGHRFELARAFFEHDAARYRAEALAAARASLAGDPDSNDHGPVAEWMVAKVGAEVLPDLVAYLASTAEDRWFKRDIVAAAAQGLKEKSLPALLAALNTNDPELALSTLPHLMALGDDSQDRLILETLGHGFQDPQRAVKFVRVAGGWKVTLLSEQLWALLAHKSKPVRDAAARALATLGDDAVARAGRMLLEAKADTRQAVVILLSTLNSAKAVKLLEKHVDDEPDDDVRDAILLGLEAAWAANGRKVTRKEVDARIARAAFKLKEPPAGWISEAKLPALQFKDGKPLGREAIRYLLYRQSRAREICADVEAKPLYALIDRSKSGDFALEILNRLLASKAGAGDRWALAVAGLLGDDRVVPILNQQIRHWADSGRGKMAEYAVEALSLLGTDSALLTIDALTIRYRAKNRNVGRAAVDAFAAAAERLGISPDELGDRVVPWLGFEPGKPRIIECGRNKFEARISIDFKLKFTDLDNNKTVASLPKTAPKEVLAQFKELGATLREVSRAQVLRLENLMVRQHRWPVVRWNELFTMHPLLAPLAARLIWGAYDEKGTVLATFRVLDDRTLTRASDEPYRLPVRARVGIVHPLELSDDDRKAWQTHLADYEIVAPFPQLERPVVPLMPERADKKTLRDFAGAGLNAMTFKGRADRLGWTRGSVRDGGAIPFYFKGFPSASVDVVLELEDMYIGADMDAEITIQDAFFVRSGSVKTGSYTYDEPGHESDDRVLRFGDVPSIVYSEVMGDLQRIAGKNQAAEDDEE